MRSSTSLRLHSFAAVLRAAAFALSLAFLAAGCESMRDPDGQAIPWGPSNDWEFNRVPSMIMNN